MRIEKRLRCAHAPTSPIKSGTLSPTFTLPAFAKINLSLRVQGKRADGYHDLETIFQTISLHDTLAVSAIDEPHIILSCHDRTLSTNDDNLVIRAARSLQKRFGSKR